MNRKSQITVFIIIGLLILLSTVLIFYIRSKAMTKDLVPKLDNVPDDQKELQGFILGCVDQTATEALVKIGEHGGYIDPADPDLSLRYFNQNPMPTESDVVYMNPGYEVPYWWYLKSPSDCTDCIVSDENIPTIIDIQDQVNRYVDTYLGDCLSGFGTFADEGISVRENGNISTKTIIADSDVIVYVNYPITAYIGGQTASMENFPVEINLDFTDIYSLSVAVAQGEKDSQYLETILMHLISSYSAPEPTKLPPTAAFEEGFGTVTWARPAVEQELRDILQSYIPFIQVNNTKGYEKIESGDPFQDAMYKVFTLNSNVSYPGKEVSFSYLNWPIHLDITPRTGELLKPTSYRTEYPFNIAPTTQTNHYEFFYDVAFPVVVEIRDDEALSKRGYSFVFALEGNVIDNKNLALWHIGEGTIGPWDYSSVTYSMTDNTGKAPTLTEYDEQSQKYVNKSYSLPKKRLMCDESQRLSGNITIFVRDRDTGDGISRASVSFGCGNYGTCTIGMTDTEGRYIGRLPVCIGGGYLTLERDGYAPAAESSLSIRPGQGQIFRVRMKPLKQVTASVRLLSMESLQGPIYDVQAIYDKKHSSVPMQENEEAMMTISKVKDDLFEPGYSQFVDITGSNSQNIMLSEGKYTISGTFMDLDGFSIPEHNETIGGQKVLLHEMDMKPALLGGIDINDGNGYWIISSDDVKNENVELYLFRSEVPTTSAGIELASSYRDYSDRYRSIADPDFS